MLISPERLLDVVRLALSAVDRRSILPLTDHLLIRVGNGLFGVIGRNSEYQIEAQLEVETAERWAIAVPAKPFADLLSKLPTCEVEITCDGNRLSIRAGRGRYRLAGHPEGAFPILEPTEAKVQLEIPPAAMGDLLEGVLYAVAQNDPRPALNGLLLEVEGGVLKGVASDGHRLAEGKLLLDREVGEEIRAIVPRRAAFELYRKLKGATGKVLLSLGPVQIAATIPPDRRFRSYLLDAAYPPYERAFPAQIQTGVVVDRQPLLNALLRVCACLGEKERKIVLKGEEGRLAVSCFLGEVGHSAEEELSARLEGEPFETPFNPDYLIDALKHLKGETIRIGFASPDGPFLFEDGGSIRHVVMPMRP